MQKRNNSDIQNEFNHTSLPSVPNSFRKLNNNNIKMNNMFFLCFCTKHDGVRKLILNGNDLYPRIGRRLYDSDIYNLLNFLESYSDIISISLAYNAIRCQGFIDIINHIIIHNHISELNMQNNDIGSDGIEKMCEIGAKLKLKTLRLNGNKFGHEAAKNIALMLRNNSHIEHIDVAEVDQTISSLVYFTTVLRSDQDQFNNNLKILDISRPNPMHMFNFDSTHFAAIIGSMLKTNTCLVELHLQKFGFSCHDIEIMLIDGMNNKTLQLIDLSCNNIGDHGINSICNWLYQRPALAGLMLSHNIIATGGARALSFALPFSRVRLLDISHNNIDDNGTTDILNTIKKSPCMRDLRLFGNRIRHRAAQIIHRMLASGVLMQDNLDVKPYEVDDKYFVAYYPADHYKQRYYNVPLYGIPQPLKIPHENNIYHKILGKKFFTHHDPYLGQIKNSQKPDCNCLNNNTSLSITQSVIESDNVQVGKSSESIDANN